MLKKAKEDKEDPYLVLLELRNTPISNGIESPNRLMFNRNVRGVLPDFLEHRRPENEPIRDKLVEKQISQKYFPDKRSRNLPDLSTGETVRIQNKDKTWEPGLVIHKSDKPRACEVMKESGTILTRNRKYLNRDQNGNFRVKHPPDYFDELPHNEETNRENENTFDETREVEQQLPTEIAANPKAPKKHAPPPRATTRSGRAINRPGYLKDYIT